MKVFVKKLIVFILIFISSLIVVMFLLVKLNKKLFQNYSTNQVNTIFIVDSHMEMGLNDKLIPGALNLSKSSDGYLHSYVKLKAFLEKESHIPTIVLSYSAHNLSAYFDTFIEGRDARFGFSDYFPLLPADEKYELLRRNHLLAITSLSLVLKKGFLNLFTDTGRYSFLGGYSPQRWKLTEYKSIDKRINVQFYNEIGLLSFSEIQLQYLEKIIQLCANHGAKLVLMEMPLHPHYRKQIPASYNRAMNDVINNKSILWMNCRQLELPDSLFLPDGDHVNADGSDTTTRYIHKLLNPGD